MSFSKYSFVVLTLLTLVLSFEMANSEAYQCPVQPDLNWTDSEKWAWDQICRGLPADMQKVADHSSLSCSTEPDPLRQLSSDFLQKILSSSPFKEVAPQKAQFICVDFFEGIDLSKTTIESDLDIRLSSLSNTLNLSDAHIIGDFTSLMVDFQDNDIQASGVTIGDDLFLHAINVGNVRLVSGRVLGNLQIGSPDELEPKVFATFNGRIDADALFVGNLLSVEFWCLQRNLRFTGNKYCERCVNPSFLVRGWDKRGQDEC